MAEKIRNMAEQITYNQVKFKEEIEKMLLKKEAEQVEFLNRYMTPNELERIGEDIIRNMPNMADVAKIIIKLIE